MSLSAPTPAVTDFGSLAALRASARQGNDPETVRKAAQQFEALFTQELLKAARAANLGEDILGGGQTGFYQDMFDQQMALHLSSGKGLGLSDLLVEQMMGASAAADTPAGAVGLSGPQPSWQSIFPNHVPVGAAMAHQKPVASSSPDAFVGEIRPHAERAAQKLGVPAEAIMAQAALETGWGRKVPTQANGQSSHNLFGIKATADWDGARLQKTTHEHLGGRMQKVTAEFRSYDSIGDAIDDYTNFLLSNPRYADALREGATEAGFARGLQKAGYATDPDYADKILSLTRSDAIRGARVDAPVVVVSSGVGE